LLRLIEGLWLQTGPYMNLLYPDFISSSRGPAGRQRLIEALEVRDATAARREMETDIRRALSYVADLADENGNIAPAAPATAGKRRSQPTTAAAFELQAN
jgi:DNA-binding GntR family transcriptional regulator